MKKNIKILIIEDDTMISMQIENLIQTLAYSTVGIARNSEEAFKLSLEKKIDLVISDIHIEGNIDGIEVSKILFDRYGIPIIFVTAFQDMETLKKASGVEYAGYVIKPFREDELKALINLAILKYNLPLKKEYLQIDKNYFYSEALNELYYQSKKIELTTTQQKLLQLLVNFQNETIEYKTIDENVWEGKVVLDDARRQLIYRFKQKVPNFPLELIKGLGYRLNVM